MAAPLGGGRSGEDDAPRYRCAECGGGITTADDLVTVNVNGHGKAAHRTCPIPHRDQPRKDQA